MSLMKMFNNVATPTNEKNKNKISILEELPEIPLNAYAIAKRNRAAPHIIPYLSPNDPDVPHYDFNCMPYRYPDGREIYIYGERPTHNLLPDAMPKEWYRSMEEVLDHPGQYTWMLFDIPDNKPLFIAAKHLTPAEIMSKHKNIQRNYNTYRIIAAGECNIDRNRNVLYNFLSGTFMIPIISKFKHTFGANTNYRNVYNNYVRKLWNDAGANSVTYTDETILSSHMNETAPFHNYIKLGYTFHQFPTRQECDAYRYKSIVGRGGRRKTIKKQTGSRRKYTKRH